MKKTLLSIFICCILSANVQSQLLVEDFDYANSYSIGSNGWFIHSGSTDSIYTTTGLTYSGYIGSGIGLAAEVIGSSLDYNKGFTQIDADGASVYLSFLVKVTEPSTSSSLSGGYFLHIGNRTNETSFTSFAARFFAKTDSATGNVNFGLSNTSTATYAPLDYARNTTYLVIIKYTISTAGADPIKMWIRTNDVPANEAMAGTPDLESTTSNGQNIINAIAIRQSSQIPDVILDGIRIDTAWGLAPLPIKLTSFNAVGLKNSVNLSWLSYNDENGGSFEVQRSIDGTSFENISIVNPQGVGHSNYEFTDRNLPLSKTLYYRLKIIHADGRFEYSNIQKVTLKDVKLTISPNPAAYEVLVNSSENIKNIEVFDIRGRRIMVKDNINLNQIRINTTSIKNGTYIIKTLVDGEIISNKIIIKH